MENSALIDKLASELEPVKPPCSASRQFFGWLITFCFIVVGLSLIVGPFRENSFSQLFQSSRYFLEALVGLIFVVVSGYSAITFSLPGQQHSKFSKCIAPCLLATWIGLIVYGIYYPAQAPSYAGQRTLCVLEVFAYAIPGFALLLFALRKGVTFERKWAGAFIGFAACGAPAVLMQFACMYNPTHNLIYHVLPVLAFGAIGALLGRCLLPKV